MNKTCKLAFVALEITVLSPEKTVLTYRLAGLGSRFVAHFIDVLCLGFLMYMLLMILTALGGLGDIMTGFDLSTATGGVAILIATLMPFAYFILFEGLWNGFTPGKKLSNIRVRMADGTPITFAASVARNLLRFADFMPILYLFGTISMFVNPRFQRIGDVVGNTIVTHEDRVFANFSVAPHRVGIHPLEHIVGELRNMSDDQYYLLRKYCDRFPELTPEVQHQLTEEVWIPIAKNLSIPMQSEIHPLYLAEATVMKYGRQRGLL